jgi:hypothetical protein
VLKARLSLLLLVGALLGLFGQGMAYAAGPTLAPKMEMSHAMPSGMDCAGMATRDSAPEHPCKGLTLACIAQMGCVIPMTFEEAAPATQRMAPPRLRASWPISPTLAGLEVEPEPEPPTA